MFCSWFVEHFSEVGDWVADLCAGSGSTTCAALLAGRSCSAVELSPGQIDCIKTRVVTLDQN